MNDNHGQPTTELWAFGLKTNAPLSEVLGSIGQMFGQMAAGVLPSGNGSLTGSHVAPQIPDHRSPSARPATMIYVAPEDPNNFSAWRQIVDYSPEYHGLLNQGYKRGPFGSQECLRKSESGSTFAGNIEVFGVDEAGGGDTGNARTQLGTGGRRSGPPAIS